jgi:EAL domain-containing protein (putative c-di-GMP-specific phosphodiesterase class I)
VLAHRPELSVHRLSELRRLGVGLAIDGYGTSAVPPAGIERMPVDTLKIDRSLVSRLGGADGAGADADAFSSAVELGHMLGLEVIAEGVETDLQLARVRDLGCDGAQGFLFSQPIPEEGIYHLLGSS